MYKGANDVQQSAKELIIFTTMDMFRRKVMQLALKLVSKKDIMKLFSNYVKGKTELLESDNVDLVKMMKML